ncbi:MAG: hypothetical protein KJ566_00285 [Nanoarchaeota archaeon]|nr:hypothetical protein [Nanoarchaeota archaeon]
MGKENLLEVKVVLHNKELEQEIADMVHSGRKNDYLIYASKEFLDDPLAKIQLGSLVTKFFESSKQTSYEVIEVVFKYKPKRCVIHRHIS